MKNTMFSIQVYEGNKDVRGSEEEINWQPISSPGLTLTPEVHSQTNGTQISNYVSIFMQQV